MNLLFQRLKQGTASGQVVVVLVLFMALVVVFIAIVINLGKLAQIRTLVSLAADTTAISSASAVGSYALALNKNVLGGKGEVCGPSEWIRVIGKTLIWIAAIVYLFFTKDPITASAILKWGAVAIAALGWSGWVASKADNISSLNSMFNKQMKDFTVNQRFEQSALQTALFSIVGDSAEIPDTYDLDMDRLDAGDGDKILRLALLHSIRLQQMSKSYVLQDAIYGPNGFADYWKNFVCYLSADGFNSPGNCCPNFSGDSFLTQLGEDGGNLNSSTGIYRLFYEIESWGYSSLGPVWRSLYQPCWYTNPEICTFPNRYCLETVGRYWDCLDSPSQNDGVDDMHASMRNFVDWSFPTLWSGDNCQKETDLVATFDAWYPSIYHEDGGSWYDTTEIWMSELSDVASVLGGENTGVMGWIIRNKCVGSYDNCRNVCAVFNPDGTCAEYWSTRFDRVSAAQGRLIQAYAETDTFKTAIEALRDKYAALDSPDDRIIKYSWRDKLGWHHVFAKIEHTRYPEVKKDTGVFEDCKELKPKYCGRRGAGALKIRVVRYDENSPNWLSFAGGKRLWRFLFTHPASGPDSSSVGSLSCEYGGASGGHGYTNPDAGINCSGIDDSLLHGIKSETCAEWGPNPSCIRFIPCGCYGSGACSNCPEPHC